MGPSSIAGVVGGAALGAAGSLFSGFAGATSAKYKAAIAGINSRIAQQNAQWAMDAGNIKAEEQGLQAGAEIAQTKVAQAASDLDVNRGSAVATRNTQVAVADFDQKMTRFNAGKAAWSDEAQAAADTAQQKLDLQTAQYDVTAGYIGAASSILGGATSVASKWKDPSGTLGSDSSSSGVGLYDPNNFGAAPTWGY